MKGVSVGCALAGVFWFVLFSPWTAGSLPFWPAMVAATGILAALALATDRERLRLLYVFRPQHALIGVASAAILYVAFFVGHAVVSRLFGSAGQQVARVYRIREGASPTVITALLLLWIGPAEEVFWRGFVQRRLAERWGPMQGWLAASAVYTLVHLWSFNLMLLAAAGLCGLFWGALYWHCRSVWPGLISHALWDVTIFVLLPIT